MKCYTSRMGRFWKRSLFTGCLTALASTMLVSISFASDGNTPSEITVTSTTSDSSPSVVPNSTHPGLLILSHGSPSARWNGQMEELTEKVRTLNASLGTFHAVEGAFLEFAQPDAAVGIEKLEAAGCDRVIVVPAFIFPTSHSHFDVPAVLGLYTSPSVRKTLKEENARVASPKIPVTMTQTLSEGDLLDRYLVDETRKMSHNPERESLLVIAHGDAAHDGLITPTMRRITTAAANAVDISQSEWVFCGMGQQFYKDVTPAVERLSTNDRTILVVGVYIASSAQSIRKTASEMPMGSHDMESIETTQHTEASQDIEENAIVRLSVSDPFEHISVIFSENMVLNHPDTAPFILKIASEAL